jgi:hypothetical protein
LSALELQDVENFMLYKDFQYERHEWDNIPIIVPRFIIYLSKYVKGLSSFARKQSEMESTEDLREDLDRRYKVKTYFLKVLLGSKHTNARE